MGCSSTKINSDSNSNNNYNRPCCCPSCGEPAGQNFKGSGNKQITFNCLKCGKKKKKKIILNVINVIVFFVINVHK
jgi:hypothetical protein